MNATFADLSAATSAGLKLESCVGEPVEQLLTGTTTLKDPTLELSLTMGGETSNVFRFLQSSQITTAKMEGLDFELGSVETGFGVTGTIIPAFDMSETFNAFLVNEFSDVLEPLMIDAMNNAVNSALPIGL